MTLLVVYGMAAIIGGAAGVVGNVASTGASVGAATSQAGGAGNNAINSLAQQAQNVLASATAQATSPQAEQDARQNRGYRYKGGCARDVVLVCSARGGRHYRDRAREAWAFVTSRRSKPKAERQVQARAPCPTRG